MTGLRGAANQCSLPSLFSVAFVLETLNDLIFQVVQQADGLQSSRLLFVRLIA